MEYREFLKSRNPKNKPLKKRRRKKRTKGKGKKRRIKKLKSKSPPGNQDISNTSNWISKSATPQNNEFDLSKSVRLVFDRSQDYKANRSAKSHSLKRKKLWKKRARKPKKRKRAYSEDSIYGDIEDL